MAAQRQKLNIKEVLMPDSKVELTVIILVDEDDYDEALEANSIRTLVRTAVADGQFNVVRTAWQ